MIRCNWNFRRMHFVCDENKIVMREVGSHSSMRDDGEKDLMRIWRPAHNDPDGLLSLTRCLSVRQIITKSKYDS